jgi:hypothetical protein
MLRPMGGRVSLSGDQWEALLHLPFAVYSTVADADADQGSAEAQFRSLREEIEHGRSVFAEGTTGADLANAVAGNLDVLWSAHRASGRSPEEVAGRAMKVLHKIDSGESEAIRDWLLVVALGVARAIHTVGEPPVSWSEVYALRDLARWLKRPLPAITES